MAGERKAYHILGQCAFCNFHFSFCIPLHVRLSAHCLNEPHGAFSFAGYNFGVPDFDPDVDYYEILQVHPRAHQEVIKRAYRTIMAMLQGHPDLGGNHDAAVRINQAYAVLSNAESRKAYDAARQVWKGGGRTAPPPPPRPQPSRAPGTGAVRPQPPREIRLQRRMDRELVRHGEIHLHPVHVPRGKRLQCLRCHYEWTSQNGNGMPVRCPRCRSRQWSDFRLFLCRHCRERFSSTALIVIPYLSFAFWPWPYWVFPICPACGRSHWHTDCEIHPLRGVLNLFKGAMKEWLK